MEEFVERNGISIDIEVATRIKRQILTEEQLNHRTKELDRKDLIKAHMKVLEGEVNAVAED